MAVLDRSWATSIGWNAAYAATRAREEAYCAYGLGCCRICGADYYPTHEDDDVCVQCKSARSEIEALALARGDLEAHVGVNGGCQASMFLGECSQCDRYYDLDDRVRALELAAA